MNPLDEIRTFLAVARHRSFTLAARQLELSPTAISKGVRLMEQKHGVVLFRRTTRSVSLTEAGEKLLPRSGPPWTRSRTLSKHWPSSGTVPPAACG